MRRSFSFGLAVWLGLGCAPIDRPLDAELIAAAAPPERPAPLALTASDGTGLRLTELSLRASLDDPLALTELHLTFENPEERVLEGNFEIVLPPAASLSRFAMKNGEGWQEGEVVEKQAARRAYEDFLHRKQDPALLEQAPGNVFAARVFPIPARGKKELILTYSQALERGASYTFPLLGLPQLGHLSIRVFGGGPKPLATADRDAFVPGSDLVVRPTQFARTEGLRAGQYVLTRFVPFTEDRPDPLESCVILVDTSASRGLGLHEEVELVARLVASLPAGAQVRVAAFDQSTELVFDGAAAEYGSEASAALLARGALGASNLTEALTWLEGTRPLRRMIVVGDGVATAGESKPGQLREQLHRLWGGALERVDAVVLGGSRDPAALAHLVHGGAPHDGVVVDAAEGLEALRRRLDRATHSHVPVRIDGATWSYPTTLDGVQAGAEVRVLAEVPVGVEPRVFVGDRAPFTPALRQAEPALLERAWAGAKIQSLLEREPEAEGVTAQIVELSRRHRVLAPQTAMLVLETDADYSRFGIDRNAKLDVLTVEAGHVAVAPASRALAPPSAPVPTWSRESTLREAAEFGIIGLLAASSDPAEPEPVAAASAHGSLWGEAIGSSFGSGAGFGARTAAPSPVRLTVENVSGTLPREVVRRIAVQNVGRVRLCGERHASPAGALTVRLVIDSNGHVANATGLAASVSPPVVRCVVRALQELSFPEPEHGAETVRLGIVLEGAPAGRSMPAVASAAAPPIEPYAGPLADVMRSLAEKKVQPALDQARAWQRRAPGDVMALVAVGEAAEATGDPGLAARAYGSILELYSFRADFRRFAGERLERIGDRAAFALAAQAFAGAVEQRPDHPASHRLLAYSQLRAGRPEQAFAALETALQQHYPEGRFLGAHRILAEDLALVGLAWIASEPGRAEEAQARAAKLGVELESEREPSLRFVLVWETDANDVDFHVHDGRGGHAFFGQPELPSGGRLYADVTTGYGPECFTIRGTRRAYPYTLSAHYFSRGPMGYGMGKLQVLEHDGTGQLRFDERPFVIMRDGAFVDLGAVKGAL